MDWRNRERVSTYHPLTFFRGTSGVWWRWWWWWRWRRRGGHHKIADPARSSYYYYMSGVVVVEIFKQTLTLLCSLSTKQTKVKFCLNWTKGRWFHIGQRFFGRRWRWRGRWRTGRRRGRGGGGLCIFFCVFLFWIGHPWYFIKHNNAGECTLTSDVLALFVFVGWQLKCHQWCSWV